MRPAFYCIVWTGVFVVGRPAYPQSLLAPPALGMGSRIASVGDTRGFDANPAGIIRMRDWDLTVSSYVAPGGQTGGMVFQSIALGKLFLDRHALAFQYSPGRTMEFIIPTTVFLGGSTPVSNDEQLEYNERFCFSYAFSMSQVLSVGATARWRTARATDTQFELREVDTTSLIVPDQRTYETSTWLGDAGLLWEPVERLNVGLVGRNLISVETGSLPAGLAGYALPGKAAAEIGVAYEVHPRFRFAAEFGTQKTGAAGMELMPVSTLVLRLGTYLDASGGSFLTAVCAGLGLHYEFADLDVGYIRFIQQDQRSGRVPVGDFDPARITTLDMNPYSTDRLGVSVRALFGNVRDRLARIESVTMDAGVYPSSSSVLAYSPVGKVRVRNISSKPIQARASFLVDRYMDAPTESQPVSLMPGEEVDIPLTAVFNDGLKSVTAMTVREGTVYVTAEPAGEFDDRSQTPVVIYGRNDWDGNAMSLRYFVTPNDPSVIRTARDILLDRQDSLESTPVELRVFRKIQLLLNAFAGKLISVGDPRQSADFVQYPSETLELRSGDCDDMTVCFSALLNSIGISTAFVDVLPPERPQDGHVFLLVDTGLEPRFGESISSNPKRFVIRKGGTGPETVWIPIETTVIRQGFEEAWSSGAQRYFDDVEIGLGLARGWVRIVNVQ